MITATRCAKCAGQGMQVKSSPGYNPGDPYIKWVPAHPRPDTYPLSEAILKGQGHRYCPECGGKGEL